MYKFRGNVPLFGASIFGMAFGTHGHRLMDFFTGGRGWKMGRAGLVRHLLSSSHVSSFIVF